MDRKGKQKIKYLCLILGAIALMVTVFFCKIISENRIYQEQKKELSTIYPEIADELSENIGYYADKNMRIDILIMVAFLLLTVIVPAVTYFLLSSKMKHRLTQVENELNYIYEQQIFDLKERLAQEENSTKALITDISHQLKTPLASIKMSHELSLTADFSEEERQSFVEAETREILRMEALVNILDNALKYSSSGTTININVSCLVNHVLIQVEDEGIGIPEGELHEIFQRFYRGSNAKNMVKEGAGVGLYLARNIIEQQGGSIVAKRKT